MQPARTPGLALTILVAAAATIPAALAQDERGPFRVDWKCPPGSIVRYQTAWRDGRFEVLRTLCHDGTTFLPKGPDARPFLEYWQAQKSRWYVDEVIDPVVLAMPPDDVRLGDRWPVRFRLGDVLEVTGTCVLEGWTTSMGVRCLEVTGLHEVRPATPPPPPGPYSRSFRIATLRTTSRIDPERGYVLSARCDVDARWRDVAGADSAVEGTWDFELTGIDRFDEAELDARTGRAIERAVAWLEAQQRDDGSFTITMVDPVSSTPQSIVALRAAGLPADRPSIRRAFAFLEGKRLRTVEQQAQLIAALIVTGHDRKRLEAAVATLLAARRARPGDWGPMTERPGPDDPVEIRSTAIALEALAAANRAGVAVPAEVFRAAIPLFLDRQDAAGADAWIGWKSDPDDPVASARLTGAAVLGLAEARDRAGELEPVLAGRVEAALRSGLAYADRYRPVYAETRGNANWQLDWFSDAEYGGRGTARATGRHPTDGYCRRLLLAIQMPDGSWQGGLPQTTSAIRYLVATRE